MEDMRGMVHSADMLDIRGMLGIVGMIDLVAMMDMLDKVIRLKLHIRTQNQERYVFFYFLMPMNSGKRFSKICFESFCKQQNLSFFSIWQIIYGNISK